MCIKYLFVVAVYSICVNYFEVNMKIKKIFKSTLESEGYTINSVIYFPLSLSCTLKPASPCSTLKPHRTSPT